MSQERNQNQARLTFTHVLVGGIVLLEDRQSPTSPDALPAKDHDALGHEVGGQEHLGRRGPLGSEAEVLQGVATPGREENGKP